jgi:protocatechuate 3,4-dioxygenase beta subunit
MKRDATEKQAPSGSGEGSVTRRAFLHTTTLGTATLLWVACGDEGSTQATTNGVGSTGTPGGTGGSGTGTTTGPGTGGAGGDPGTGGAPPDGGLDATPQCEEEESEDNIEGPFYKEGAPPKSDLTENGMPGVRLTISGSVLGLTCEPLAGALIDVWQADDAGAYDAVGFILRGTLNADAEGHYSVKTIIPGHYLNGNQFRPAHIHVKVSAPGFVLLTTQLYIEGDPYNDIDPFIKDSLIMTLTDLPGGEKAATFNFVLAPT